MATFAMILESATAAKRTLLTFVAKNGPLRPRNANLLDWRGAVAPKLGPLGLHSPSYQNYGHRNWVIRGLKTSNP